MATSKIYNILLLGKSGYGKSRTAMSLCGDDYIDESTKPSNHQAKPTHTYLRQDTTRVSKSDRQGSGVDPHIDESTKPSNHQAKPTNTNLSQDTTHVSKSDRQSSVVDPHIDESAQLINLSPQTSHTEVNQSQDTSNADASFNNSTEGQKAQEATNFSKSDCSNSKGEDSIQDFTNEKTKVKTREMPKKKFKKCRATSKSRRAGSFKIGDMTVNVIDTPGCLDNSDVDDVRAAEYTFNDILDACEKIEENTGFNAFVLVYKFGVKYTREEQSIVNRMLLLLKNKQKSSKFIILFTNADEIQDEVEDGDLWTWLAQERESEMRDLIRVDCEGRFITFENRRATDDVIQDQKNNFAKILEKLTKPVTSEDVRTTLSANREEFMQKATELKRKNSFRKKIDDIFLRVYEAEKSNRTEKLNEIEKEFNYLIETAHKDDVEELQREKKNLDDVMKGVRSKRQSKRYQPTSHFYENYC